MPENPYYFKGSTSREQFFGRKKELRELNSWIVKAAVPSSCSLVGETRIGKSSLLDMFLTQPHVQRPSLLFLKYDVGSAFKTGGTEDFYQQFIDLVSSDILKMSQVILPFAIQEQALLASRPGTRWIDRMRYIENFFQGIHTAGYWLIIAFDEFDYIIEQFKFDPQGWKVLRALGDEQKYGISYLISSRRSLEKLEEDAGTQSSNFAAAFVGSTINLNLMPEQEALELVNLPVTRLGMPWTEEQPAMILTVTGRHPFCIQMVCSYLFNRREEGTLDQITSQAMLIEQLREPFHHFFDHLRKRLTKAGLFDTLLKIAHGVPTDADPREIDDLKNLGYLISLPGKSDEFQPFSPTFDFYLKACGKKTALWEKLERVELMLRRLVEQRYRQKFSEHWLDEIQQKNPGRPAQGSNAPISGMIENWKKAREKELSNPFHSVDEQTSLIDFSYIGDLKHLIHQQPTLFQDVFVRRPKDELVELLDPLIPIRNSSAHYRRINPRGMALADYCCQTLLNKLITLP